METSVFPQAPGAEKLKAYWNRPGGKFGTLIGLGVIIAVGWWVLPILTAVVWNMVNFGIAMACLGAFLFIVTNRKLRLSLFYLWEIAMKALVGTVIKIDPFIIAEDDIKDMKATRDKLYEQSEKVEGQKQALNQKLDEKKREFEKEQDKARAAQKNNMTPELTLATRQMSRIQEYVKQLVPIRDNLGRVSDYLTKIFKNSGYLIQDAESELELKKDLYKSVTAGNKALGIAMRLFKGDPEKKLLVEQSMNFLKEDIANKLGNMKKAMDYTTDIMRNIDLENATFEEQGLRMLEKMDTDKDFTLNKILGQVDLSGATAEPVMETVTAPGTVNTEQYNNLLK